ncbi:MAG: type II toxin-antitoxin system prevent-host-death family antitoxin [Nocardioides sp.]|uniref:type II toxin-antitoxin system Phd/YefM family antitoxin n=1 Tax=Nocardioides sp. TaxID=35761 RepID=UPI0039E24A11
METISQREMRNNSGEYLRRTAAGETFAVTNNGTVVAWLTPPPVRSGLDDAAARGELRRATASPSALRDVRRSKSAVSTAQILEDSRGRW